MLARMELPPLWLGLALVISWALSLVWSVPGFAGLGAVLIALGLAVMGLALVQMVLAKTTFIPRRTPSSLLRSGVFRISRNPIYLGDALVLTGAILHWGAMLALPLIPAFIVLITQRFILDEEERLRIAFGDEYLPYTRAVRRWI